MESLNRLAKERIGEKIEREVKYREQQCRKMRHQVDGGS